MFKLPVLLVLLYLMSGCAILCTKIIGVSFTGPKRIVELVFPGSPADKAGIKEGDELAFKWDMETHYVILRPTMVNGKMLYEQKEFIIQPICKSEIQAMKPLTWADTATPNGYSNPRK